MRMLPNRLRYLRKLRGFSQEGLGKKINATKSTISNYENDYSTPSNDVLKQLADTLDTTTDYLLGRTNNYSPGDSDESDSLAEIKKIVEDYGIEDIFFHNIDDWKDLTDEDIKEIKNHFRYITHKAKERKEKRED